MAHTLATNNVKRFPSTRNIYVTCLLWICVSMIALAVIMVPNEEGALWFRIIITPVAMVLLWILIDTSYTFDELHFHYRSGPIRGKIPYDRMRRVEHDEHFFKSVILKPGLGRKGLMIYFDTFNEIYVSPKDRTEFITELQRRAPQVVYLATR